MERDISVVLERCLQRPGVPQRLDSHEWPLSVLFSVDSARGHGIQDQLCMRPIIITCSTLGGGLPLTPQSALEQALVIQVHNKRAEKSSNHYGFREIAFVNGEHMGMS